MNVKRNLKFVVPLLVAFAGLAALLLLLSSQYAWAQSGGEVDVYKTLGRADPVVHVGEYLTFTIRIRNDAAFTITTLPLADTYNAAVLAYADASPPPDSVDPGAGRIDWADLTTAFGPLPPGEEIVVVVGFIAEHPAEAIVNAAEVHDVVGSGGTLSDTESIVTGTQSMGGSSPVEKELLADLIPEVGLPLTFTIRITNDGYTTLTVAPLVDHYNPTWLAFSYADPPPDAVDQAGGVLTWSDVTSWTGDIPAHGTVMVTTVFTALVATDEAANEAEVADAEDWYGNDLAGGADQVPITIIGGPQPTTTPTPPSQPGPTPTSPPQPDVTPTPPSPPLLPPTGESGRSLVTAVQVALLLLAGAGWAWRILYRRSPD
jgi:hypothetical protein